MGVPLIVSVFELKVAVTPDGNPVAVPMPVAPVVVYVISVIDVLIHLVWLSVPLAEDSVIVLFGLTVKKTSFDVVLQPSEEIIQRYW